MAINISYIVSLMQLCVTPSAHFAVYNKMEWNNPMIYFTPLDGVMTYKATVLIYGTSFDNFVMLYANYV